MNVQIFEVRGKEECLSHSAVNMIAKWLGRCLREEVCHLGCGETSPI